MPAPFRESNLNQPGDSSVDALWLLLLDRGLLYALMIALPTTFAFMEWMRWYFDIPLQPIGLTVFAVVLASVGLWKLEGLRRKMDNHRLGVQGERKVSEYLEQLREDGAKVFHDVRGDGFNIDHVVVHSTGVYVIETKTISKSSKGCAKVRWDGERITVGGFTPDRDPVQQVRSARQWLMEQLTKSTGKKFQFRDVILYPERYVESTVKRKPHHPWVLNPKALRSFIAHCASVIPDDDVNLCAYHLDRMIRATNSAT